MKIGDYVGKWIITKIHKDRANDRVDVNGNYCPENCRWITKNENSKWKSTTVTIELFGIVDSLSGWSKRIGFHRNYLYKHRSKYGMVSCINLIKEIMHP